MAAASQIYIYTNGYARYTSQEHIYRNGYTSRVPKTHLQEWVMPAASQKHI